MRSGNDLFSIVFLLTIILILAGFGGSELLQTKQELSDSSGQLVEVTSQNQQLIGDNQSLAVEVESLRGTNQALQKELSARVSEVIALSQRNTDILGELETERNKTSELTEAYNLACAEKEKLSRQLGQAKRQLAVETIHEAASNIIPDVIIPDTGSKSQAESQDEAGSISFLVYAFIISLAGAFIGVMVALSAVRLKDAGREKKVALKLSRAELDEFIEYQRKKPKNR